MRPVRISRTGVGVTAPVPLDNKADIFNIGLGLIVSGTVTVTVQFTFDDVFAPAFNPATATWFDHPDLNAETSNQAGNIAYPVTAVRLNQTAGTGVSTLVIIQAGNRG